MRKHVLASILLATVCSSGSPQGIPVFDGAAIAQAVQQVTAWGKQFTQMKESIETAKQQLAAQMGARNLGAILDNVGMEATVPSDIAQKWRALSRHEDLINQALSATNVALRATTDRGAQVRALMQAINATNDPKSIAELQARIQAEQALVANDLQRVNLMKMQADKEQQRIEQQLQEESRVRRAKPPATW